MQSIKIPIESTQEVIIGDIWVNVDIEFKPMMEPRGVKESLVLSSFNAQMDVVAAELKREIKEKLTKHFSPQQEKENI